MYSIQYSKNNYWQSTITTSYFIILLVENMKFTLGLVLRF